MPQTTVRVGQRWEVHRGDAPDNPMVMEVTELSDDRDRAYQVTTMKLEPQVRVSHGWMHWRELTGMAILVAGPGGRSSQRPQLGAHALDLLRYEGRRLRAEDEGHVRIPATSIVRAVADDVEGDKAFAQSIVREALTQVDGTESTSPYDHHVEYVLPVTALGD